MALDPYRIFGDDEYPEHLSPRHENHGPVLTAGNDLWRDDFMGVPPKPEPDVFNRIDTSGFTHLTPQETAYWRRHHRSPRPHSQSDLRKPKFD